MKMKWSFLLVVSILISSQFAFSRDWEDIKKSREVRVMVNYGPSEYFVLKGKPSGPAAIYLESFDKHLNSLNKQQGGRLPIKLKILSRQKMDKDLRIASDQVDLYLSLQITPEDVPTSWKKSRPIESNAEEVLVTSKKYNAVQSLEDLAGLKVYVREHSHGSATLEKLNEELKKKNLPLIKIEVLDPRLSLQALLEMVHVGLIPATLTRRYFAEAWSFVYKDLRMHEQFPLSENQKVHWLIPSKSPMFEKILNDFIDDHKVKTTFGNLVKRQFSNLKKVKNSVSDREMEKFKKYLSHFKRYSSLYETDYLLMMAQGYQESELDQSRRSPQGAIGVMQLLISTGRSMKVGNIHQAEPNIHAGIKYYRQLYKMWVEDYGIDPSEAILFSLASYNAGPQTIKRMRERAVTQHLDPNKWFDNVELTTLEYIGWEPIHYISNILKYYSAYKVSPKMAP